MVLLQVDENIKLIGKEALSMLPVQITAKDLRVTQALELKIRQKAEKLKQFHNQVSSCRVVISVPKNHMNRGKLYNVRVDITVPGKEFVATHKSDKDIYVAIRDAFSALQRQLEEHSRIRHGKVKTHELILHGRVDRKMSDAGYGFIQGEDGNEYYFSVTNVSSPSFLMLNVGDSVEFIPVPFDDGVQAHRITKTV